MRPTEHRYTVARIERTEGGARVSGAEMRPTA